MTVERGREREGERERKLRFLPVGDAYPSEPF
jgi:hypothetical protein